MQELILGEELHQHLFSAAQASGLAPANSAEACSM
jgi:hypothetical protein